MGKLYVVAGPIGNLKDITFRALDTLSLVDLILCEDTRITGKLLKHYNIKKDLLSIRDYNELQKIPDILNLLSQGKNIALVSDAGTPLISDPGFKFVREVIKRGISVESIPGPSSVICSLTVSAMPTDKFMFLGYLPKKSSQRKDRLKSLLTILQSMEEKKLRSTVIFFESPYRFLATLKDLYEIFGDINIVICRELTKIHEEIRRDTISKSINHFSNVKPKGEFTLLLNHLMSIEKTS